MAKLRVCMWFISLMLFGSTWGAAQSAQDAHALAEQHAAHLRKGINASMWFAQAPGHYDVARLRTFTTPDDIRLIHSLGFDHIRLSIDADPLMGWYGGSQTGAAFLGEVDRVVDQANGLGLAVIIDVHPESSYKRTLFAGNEGVEHFAMLWQKLAEHFAGKDPNLVFFEIMNEPEQQDPFRWQGIQAQVVERIHQVAPKFTIIATGARWSGLEDLLRMEPLADGNIIYNFHDYEPMVLTHQAATWTTPELESLSNVPYPSTPDNVAANLAQEPTLAGQLMVENYGLDRWDAEHVERTIEFAARWGKVHHAPIYCGEFGVHRKAANPQARAAWLHDMRVAFEKNGIGWAMWDYQTNFGIVTKSNGATTPDPLVVDALGLKKQ